MGKTVAECQELVDAYVTDHPDDFNNQTSLYLDIRKIRELTDESYYKVVIRTNEDGTLAYGIFDDGECETCSSGRGCRRPQPVDCFTQDKPGDSSGS